MERPDDPKKAILSMHRPLREAAAKKLAGENKELLRPHLKDANPCIRAAALNALININDHFSKEQWPTLKEIADKDTEVGVRELAVRALGVTMHRTKDFAGIGNPPLVRAAAMNELRHTIPFFPPRGGRLPGR